MSNLNYQQIAVFERVSNNNETVKDHNAGMRGRASLVATASAAVVGLVTAAEFLPGSSENNGIGLAILSLTYLCTVAIYFFTAQVWKTGITSLPGGFDLDHLYDAYISQDEDQAYANLLKDECEAFRINTQENDRKGSALNRAVNVFILQLLILALSIGVSAIGNASCPLGA